MKALEVENLQLQLQLQQTQAQLVAAQSRCPDGGSPPSPEQEAAANEVLREAQRLDQELRLIEARALYQQIVDTWPGSRAFAAASRRARELALVGQFAPPRAPDRWLQGEPPPPSPVQVLVFWEEWCPHCTRELPELSALAPAWAAQGVQIIGLTRLTKSSTEERVAAFYAEHQIAFPTALISDATNDAYAVTGIPAAAVVRDGVVIWRGHPAKLTPETMTRLLETP